MHRSLRAVFASTKARVVAAYQVPVPCFSADCNVQKWMHRSKSGFQVLLPASPQWNPSKSLNASLLLSARHQV
ncbi:hypothetical protein WJX77_002782 [Trebouxia sp. C0004]